MASHHLYEVVTRVRALGADGRVVVLAGPGVAATGAGSVEGLRRLAESAGLGVVNTWGAKGLFDWQSPHHLGTAGLQARDFELAGLADADLIVATGLDPHEADERAWQLAPHVVIAPRQLSVLAAAWPLPPGRPERPRLYTGLAAVVSPLYTADRVPLSAGRAVADIKAALPAGGGVFADPGLAGFWIARAFPTSELGTVTVPAVKEPGYAAWAAFQASRSGRAAVAVTTSPHDIETDDAVAYAVTAGVPFVLAVWGAGNLTVADEHRAHLAEAFAAPRVRIVEVPVDWSDTDLLVDFAGPITAWGGL